jgi:DNA-binding winged helix-turn-helix (wHTH) protein
MDNGNRHLLTFGPFQVDPDQRLLMRGQESISLPPKAFETLLVLLRNSGRVVRKDDLMKTLWPDTFVDESNLSQHIYQLRKILGPSAQDPQYIVTVPGSGYRFAQKVEQVSTGHGSGFVVENHSEERVVPKQEGPFKSPTLVGDGSTRCVSRSRAGGSLAGDSTGKPAVTQAEC